MRLRLAFGPCMAAFVSFSACGGDTDDTGTAGSGGGAGTDSGTGGSSASGGSAGIGGGSDAGDAGVPDTCDGITQAMEEWFSSHTSCDANNPCQRFEPPLVPSNSDFCGSVAAPNGDDAVLAALVAAWEQKQCGVGASCGFVPGEAACSAEGKCELVIDTSCEECDDTLDPQCADGMNAINPCFAEHCLKAKNWTPGYCPDSAACTSAGGTCEESFFTEKAPCADGFYWDQHDLSSKGCPNGNLRNECCIPWSQTCSYVAGSFTLSLDPFTCAAPTGAGQPWVCLHTGDQVSSCTLTGGTIEQPLGAKYDTDIAIVSESGSKLTATLKNKKTGRTATCTGTVSFSIDVPLTWSCTACDGADGGGSCTTCTLDQTFLCAL